MRFDELVLKVPGDELRVRFHPRMTVLSGLGALERRALADGVVAALACGGEEDTELRYTDGLGREVTLVGQHGAVAAHHDDDGTAASAPLGTVAPNRGALRALALLTADDLGLPTQAPRPDDPPELQDARATLEEISAELDAALAVDEDRRALVEELQQVEEALRTAADTVARREYAEVLAALEKVRAEAAALGTGAQAIEADRKLVAAADTVRTLATRWRQAVEDVAVLEREIGVPPQDGRPRTELTQVPTSPPEGLEDLVADLQAARAERDSLDHRLQALAVAKLPAPSDLLVGELGLLDQDALWAAADRLVLALDELKAIQVDLGGLGGDDGPEPALIEAIEETHRAVEDAEQAAEQLRVPGVAASGLGVAFALCGTFGLPILMPLGLLGAAGAGTVLLLKPKRKVAEARAEEAVALAAVGAPTYLGFHLRRVEATVDPSVRERVERATAAHRAGLEGWHAVAGVHADVRRAKELEGEIRDYHTALRSLDGAADEIETLRLELAEQAEPALAAARKLVVEACEPYHLDPGTFDDEATILTTVERQIERGHQARAQVRLAEAEQEEDKAGARLDDLLLQLGFESGPLDARVGALEWAVGDAAERESARARARARTEIDADIARLEADAAALRRPEWATVTAAEAALPDVTQLEATRSRLQQDLAQTRAEVDVERLADRRAAIERRVTALEAKHHGYEGNGDPGFVADLQQVLLGHLTRSAQVGPNDDPLPAVLDEVFLRVPADRKWDLLDLLHRLSERHQLIYLTDDAFVAAWARQQAAAGEITLLEPVPEPA